MRTMEAGYRKADMIELHDAQVVVHVEDTVAEGLGWREAPTVKGTYLSVDGDALAHLLQALCVPFDADLLYGDEYDVLFRRPFKTVTGTPDLPLEGVLRIHELWVRPEGERLLPICLTSRPDGAEEEEYVQEITYSGSYTVWWSLAEE